MEVNINVEDYISEAEMRKIAEEELRYAFRRQFQKESDVERVLANLSHEYVFHATCDQLSISMEEVEKRIKDKIIEALEGDSVKYKVFQRADAWDRSESPAVKILDDVLRESRPLIEAAVKREIEQYPFWELREEIADTIYDCIMRKLNERDEEVKEG